MRETRTPPPAPPAAHIKLTPVGAACLFGGGGFASLAVLGLTAGSAVIAVPAAIAAGVELAVAWASARRAYAIGMYARAPDGIVWRPEPIEPAPLRAVDLDEVLARRRCERIDARRRRLLDFSDGRVGR